LIETLKPCDIKKLQASEKFHSFFTRSEYKIQSISKVYKQQLTHQTITGQFINITVHSPLNSNNYKLISAGKIKELPFPKFITTYLKD
jgi:A/G-specific adenine glycosylase